MNDGFAVAARLFLPADGGEVLPLEPDGPPAGTVMVTVAAEVRAPGALLAAAASREAAVARARRRAEVRRVAPPSWRAGTVRRLGRAALLGGAIARPRGTRALFDDVVEEAQFQPDPALRVAEEGSVLVTGRFAGAVPAVLRAAFAGGPGDPHRHGLALAALARARWPWAPMLLAHGTTSGVRWTVEARAPGKRPKRMSPTQGQVLRAVAALPSTLGPPGQPAADAASVGPLLGLGLEAPATDDLAAVLVHGDLWSGNLLVHRGQLSAVVDWGDWCTDGMPGVDLVHLVAGERDLDPGRRPHEAARAAPWRAEAVRDAGAYWAGRGLKPETDLLEAVGAAWWLRRVGAALERFPGRAGDERWVSAARSGAMVLGIARGGAP